MSKRLVLIGASGFIGSVILKEALDRGHLVVAVMRFPEKIKITHKNLTIRKADVSSSETVKSICSGADAVISAYNPGWKNPNIAEDTLRIYPEIIQGVKQSGTKRLLIVGGAGSLFVSPGLRLMDSGAIPDPFLPAIKSLASIYLDFLTKEIQLDWVFFSPASKIEPGIRTCNFRLGKDNLIVNDKGESRISLQDYAVAMMDEVENPAHHRERFTIGY